MKRRCREKSTVRNNRSRRNHEETADTVYGPLVDDNGVSKMRPDYEELETKVKVRLGHNLILIGPKGNATDVVKQNIMANEGPEIPYGEEDIEIKAHTMSTERSRTKERMRPDKKRRTQSCGRGSDWLDEKSRLTRTRELMNGRLGHEKELRRVKLQILELQYALDAKTDELNAALSFMNSSESFSGADIISLANIFNAEVFQGAAHIAEISGPLRRRLRSRCRSSTGRYEKAHRQATVSLGVHLLGELMEEGERGSGNFILQVALQVCMVTFGCNVLQSWSPNVIEHGVMHQIYRRIFEKETQGVAGSWRSITRRTQDLETPNCEDKMNALLETITDILVVAGCWGGDNVTVSKVVLKKVQQNIARIVESTLKLRAAISDVTHMDISPLTVAPKTLYCHEIMENAYAVNEEDRVGGLEDQVLGTTELGLSQTVKTSTGTHHTILVKPKIVLRSALNSL